MTEAPDQFVWTCPGCGRRVPHRVEACRCGARRAAAQGEPGTSGRSYTLLVVAVLLGAGVSLILLRSASPRSEPTPTPIASTAPGPTVAPQPPPAPAPPAPAPPGTAGNANNET